jgi:Flp pilus assembly protein TadG
MISSGIKRYTTGSALIEFALLLPVLITLILGTIEIGWALFVQDTLVDAAREGARVAVTQNVSTTTITASIENLLTNSNLPGDKSTVTISPSAVSLQTKGTPITVQVSLPYSDVSILPTTLFLGSTTLSAQVTMVKEY